MKQCKPCITIKTIYCLAKIHWKNFRKDVKEWSRINQIACELPPQTNDPYWYQKSLQHNLNAIRKLAQENYNPKAFDNIEPENKS